MNIIEVNNVTKTFSGKKILGGVSIEVEHGTICGLVGRNGSGKTVLMKCICGFLFHDEAVPCAEKRFL